METNLDQFSNTKDDGHYTTLQGNNIYEVSTRGLQHSSAANIAMESKQKQLSSWSKPLLFITVLHCLILILLIIILGIVAVVYFKSTSSSTARVADDILLIAQELLVLHNESTALPTSCKEIKEKQPLSPSGYYILVALNGGGAYETYCNMGTLCGSGGGWTRLAYLNMSDSSQNCPSGFRLYPSGGVRACGRTNSGGGCVSVTYSSNGISYSQICGRVTGYQYGHTDGIDGPNDINAHYLDGVSITRGSPRQHVWSLLAEDAQGSCPCSSGNSGSVRSFMGTNYFCESGNPSGVPSNTLYASDPLWDGQDCGGSEGPCCSAPGIPWFHRDYGSTTTTDYIELRICADTGYTGEDSPLSFYEIYVK